MIRRWHRAKAWLGLHLRRIINVVGVVAFVLALALGGLTLWLHIDDSSKIAAQKAATKADQVARAAAAKASADTVRPAVCYLVWAYVHPAPGTPVSARSDQVESAWHYVGALTGCPNGTKPTP